VIGWCLHRYASLASCVVALVASRDNLGAGKAQLARVSAYLAARAEAGDARRFLLVPYLNRRYGHSAAARQLAGHAGRYCQALTAAGQQPFCRFVEPNAGTTLAELEALRSDTDRVLARALHCDVLGGTAELARELARASRGSNYLLTHAGIAALLAFENRCLSEAELHGFWAIQVPRLQALVEQEGAATDLGMEALIVLFVAKGPAALEPAWLASVLRAQNDDGGWGQRPGQRSWDHTSILGYWLLLEIGR
jgi:hypothetical protein